MSSMDWRLPTIGAGTDRMKTPPPRPIAHGLPTVKALPSVSELPEPGSRCVLAESERSGGSAPREMGSVGGTPMGWCRLSASSAAVRLLDGEPACVLLSRMMPGVCRSGPFRFGSYRQGRMHGRRALR